MTTGHRPSLRTMLTTALLVVLLAATASADTRAGRAQRRFEHGQQLYASGQYDDAGGEFRRAFEIDPRPKYLYNAAQALRLAGDCRGSIALYQAFLRIAPDADSRAAAARNLERCTAPAAASAVEAAAPATAAEERLAPAAVAEAPAPDPAPAAVAAPKPASPLPPAPAPTAAVSRAAAVTPTVSSVAAPRRARARWIGAVGGVASGTALVTASILEGLGASRFDHLRLTCAPHCQADDVLPLRRQLDAATGLFVVGGVLAAATLVALVVTRVRAHSAR